MSFTQKTALTLAECLLALGLLGMVAALTIPKIVQANRASEAKAKLAQVVSVLETGWYARKQDYIDLPVEDDSTLYDAIADSLTGTSLRLSPNQPGPSVTAFSSRPLDPNPPFGTSVEHPCTLGPNMDGWVEFQDGVVISGLNTYAWPVYQRGLGSQNGILCIDINSHRAPNTFGQDVFMATFNPSGDFDGSAAPGFSPSQNAKNFYWGTPSRGIFPMWPGNAVNAIPPAGLAPEASPGYLLLQ